MNVSPGDLRRILLPKNFTAKIFCAIYLSIHMAQKDWLIVALYHTCGMDEEYAAG
jgi:hypothetical protein